MGAPGQAILSGSRIANATRTWQANEDVDVADWVKASDFIFAIAVETEAGLKCASSLSLQWRNVTDGGSFADLSDTGELTYSGTTDLVNDALVTSGEAGCTPSGAQTWQDGEELESANDATFDTGAAADMWSEYHYAVDCSNAHDGDEYEFRVWDSTEGISAGTCIAGITMVAAVSDLEISSFDEPKITEDITARMSDLPVDAFDKPTVIEDIITRLSDPETDAFDKPTIIENIDISIGVPPIEINVNDQLTITEMDAGIIAAWITVIEDIQVQLSTGDLSINVFDSPTILESLIPLENLGPISKYESLTIIELINLLRDVIPGVFDKPTIIENIDIIVSALGDLEIDIFESLTIIEIIDILKDILIDKYELITVQESLSLLKDILPDEHEQITVQEIISILKDILVNPYEQITIQEFIDIITVGDNQISKSDTINVIEYVLLQLSGNFINKVDLINIAESILMSMSVRLNLFDLVTITESIIMVSDILFSKTEMINIAESIVLSLDKLFFKHDNINISEYVSLIKDVLFGVSETLTITEYINVATILAIGKLSVAFSERKPDIEYTGKKPDIAYTERKPDITFT